VRMSLSACSSADKSYFAFQSSSHDYSVRFSVHNSPALVWIRPTSVCFSAQVLAPWRRAPGWRTRRVRRPTPFVRKTPRSSRSLTVRECTKSFSVAVGARGRRRPFPGCVASRWGGAGQCWRKGSRG
jgi:hypothetical protein